MQSLGNSVKGGGRENMSETLEQYAKEYAKEYADECMTLSVANLMENEK